MSPAASFLTQAGFERIGPVKSVRGFEVWHLRTAGAADIAVAIPADEKAGVEWAVRGIFSAGEQSGAEHVRSYWTALNKAMTAKSGVIGMADMPDKPTLTQPLTSEDIDHG